MNKVDKASTPKLILLRLGQRVCSTVWLEARQCKNGDALESPGYTINVCIGLFCLI